MTASGDAATGTIPAARIEITLANPPSDGVWVGYSYSTTAIRDVSLGVSSAAAGYLEITLANAADLGAGVYTDTVAVEVCSDSQCRVQLSGSPRTVTIQYTVTGVAPPRPALTISRTSLDVETLRYSATSPVETMDVTLRDATGTQFFSVNVSSSLNGLYSVVHQPTNLNGSAGLLRVFFYAPTIKQAGTYYDWIKIEAQCIRGCPAAGVANAIQRIPIRYTISDTVSGPQGFTLRLVPVKVNDIVWSPIHKRIYFSGPDTTAIPYGHSVGAIDPSTGNLEFYKFVDAGPQRLAVSSDDQYIYVALRGTNAIERLLLPNLTRDITIPLGNDPNEGALHAEEIQVSPGNSRTIATVLKTVNGNAGTTGGVLIFDDLVPRLSAVGRTGNFEPRMDWLQWAHAALLYANTASNSSYAVSNIGVDADGAHFIVSTTGVGRSGNFGRIHLENGILYSDGGDAFDPNTRTKLGVYAVDSGYSRGVVADSRSNKLFMVVQGDTLELRSYNLTTFQLISTIPLGFGLSSGAPTRLIRWGDDGLAFATDAEAVVLIKGPFVSAVAN